MEVNRVQDKGKGKGKYKGKQKGKGSWWRGAWPFGGRGRSYKGCGKGKGRGKGKSKGKSKSKSKGKKGKGKAKSYNTNYTQNYIGGNNCNICDQSGHWARDCPQKVNQVQQQQAQQPVAPQGQQGGGTSVASGSTQSTIAYPHSTYRSTQSQPTVRRVYYEIGNSEFEGEVNMLQVTDHETEYYIIDDDLLTTSTRTSTAWDDDFHQWFNHKLDIDDRGHFMTGFPWTNRPTSSNSS